MKGATVDFRKAGWALGFAALAGAAAVLLCHQGAGLSSDTLSYFRYPATGGLDVLPVHHGILYPLLLRLGVLAGLGLPAAAVLLNVLCAAGTAAILFWHMAAGPGRRAWLLAGIVSCLVSFSLPFLIAHAYAMSEPLFLLLAALGLAAFLRGLRGESTGWLAVSAAAFGMGCLTRYAGLAFVGSACLAILLQAKKPLARRWLQGVGFGVVAVLPMVGLMGYNSLKSGSATNRDVVFRAIPADTLNEGATVLASWFLPDRLLLASGAVTRGVALCVLAILVAGLVVGIAKNRTAMGFYALCGLSYVAFLGLSILFFDVSIMLSHRMLSPLALVLFPLLAEWASTAGDRRAVRILVAAATAYLVVFTTVRAGKFIGTTYREGSGFSAVAWDRSPLVRLVEALQGEQPIYSNAADAMHLRGSADIRFIPWRQKSTSNQDLATFAAAYGAMQVEFRTGDAFLAEIGLRYWPPYLPGAAEIAADAGLIPVVTSAEGKLYAVEGNRRLGTVARQVARINGEAGAEVLRLQVPVGAE